MIGPYETRTTVAGPCDRCGRMIERVTVGCPICDRGKVARAPEPVDHQPAAHPPVPAPPAPAMSEIEVARAAEALGELARSLRLAGAR